MPCIGTPAATFGASLAVICVLVLLFLAFKRCVWKRMNKRGRRRMRATLKIVFVFFQVLLIQYFTVQTTNVGSNVGSLRLTFSTTSW